MFWIARVAGVLAVLMATVGVAAWWGAQRWSAASTQYVERISGRSDLQRNARSVRFKEMDRLPAPVTRYLRHALKDGQPLIHTARFRQAGELRAIGEGAQAWKAFAATQSIASSSPGFVWDARIRMAPLLHVRVRDAYVAGQASGHVSLLSVVSLAHEQGKPELDSGALHRYLAESAWVPTALLPRPGLVWSPVDNDTALATLTDGETTVSLEFRFNAAGEIESIYTPGRFALIDGAFSLLPWEGRFRNYQERAGMRIPIEAEVAWYLPGGSFTVWRGEIVDVEYQFAR